MKKLIGFSSKLPGIIFLSAVFMILNNCSKPSYDTVDHKNDQSGKWVQNLVSVGAYQFSPQELTINRNDTVTWTNSSGNFFRIICDSDHFSGTLRSGDSFVHVFAKTGTFEYTSNYPGMKGYVFVH
jgi:plastocyanin